RMLRGALKGEAALSPKLASRILTEFTRLSEKAIAISTVEQSTSPLTSRERQVLTRVSEGLTDKEIAARLSLSIHTVKSHMRNILAKLHVENRHAAAAYARRKGL
ncbi:MAG: response regulator transcription factor, partial [Thiogranum sp.]